MKVTRAIIGKGALGLYLALFHLCANVVDASSRDRLKHGHFGEYTNLKYT